MCVCVCVCVFVRACVHAGVCIYNIYAYIIMSTHFYQGLYDDVCEGKGASKICDESSWEETENTSEWDIWEETENTAERDTSDENIRRKLTTDEYSFQSYVLVYTINYIKTVD